MRFLLRLTFYEVRSSWRRLIFFFLCISLGVASVAGLRSLIGNLTRAVAIDARQLMTADVEIGSASSLTPIDIEKIEAVISGSSIVDGRNEVLTTASMARVVGKPGNSNLRFVELKGIEPPFPLVGDFRLSNGSPFDFGLLEDRGTVVSRILLEELGIGIGDRISIGEAEFTIRATIDDEPGGTSGFRLGPRVFIAKKDFATAGILRNSSRIRYRLLYRTTEDPRPLVEALRTALKGTTIQVQSYRETQENLSEQFERSENYLSLTGLLILVLGGIGVWNVARAFVEQKKKTVAILKCLGASGTRVVLVYLLQILLLGFAGSLIGICLAQGVLWFAGWFFAADLPANMSRSVSFSSAVQGLVLGVLVSLIFSALPLLQIMNIKPKLVLRDENNSRLRLDKVKLAIGAAAIALLLVIAIWQAGSITVGGIFLCGLAAASATLYVAAVILTLLLKKVRRVRSFALTQAVNSLYRPGNQSRLVLLAVGLGAFVVLAVQFVQLNLTREFDLTRNGALPSLFFVDVQKSQVDGLRSIVKTSTGEEPELTPTVRARIAFINGKPIDLQKGEMRQQQGQIGREFAITYRAKLEPNETITKGGWWADSEDNVPEVSVEEGMAERLKLDIGDSITFDISGRKITARVSSVRRIDLRNTRTAFVFVFRPGTLEAAPQTFAGTVIQRLPATDRQRLMRTLIDEFPNIQIFDIGDILATVQRLVNNIALAVSVIGGFVVLSGILILIGSIALTRSQRVYENAILKTLGADRRTLAIILTAEYGLLGSIAAIIGTSTAVLLSWAMCRFVLDIRWEPDPGRLVLGCVITTLVVVATGTFASFDLLFRKPLQTLRQH